MDGHHTLGWLHPFKKPLLVPFHYPIKRKMNENSSSNVSTKERTIEETFTNANFDEHQIQFLKL